MRRIATIDEIIDIMSSIRGGSFVTICYMSSAKVGKTLTSKIISNCNEIKLINQSITGLYENEVDLLTI